jgi:HAMP domain-containing protein
MDLRTKLVFALVFVSLSSMLLLATLSYGPARDLWRESALESLEALAEAKKMQIQGVVESWEDRVRLIRSRTELRRLMAGFDPAHAEGTRPALTRILSDARASLPGIGIREISLYDSHGDAVATTRGDGLDGVRELTAAEVPTRTEVKLLGLVSGAIDGPEVRFATPIDFDSIEVGTLVVRMSAQEMVDVADDHAGLGRTGEVIIATLERDNTVTFLNTPRLGEASTLNVSMSDLNDPVVHALLGADSTFYERAFDYRNQEVWAATRALPEFGIGLVVKFDRTEREEPLRNLRVTIRKYTYALASFAILVGILLGLRFAAPIQQLASVVERIDSGDYHVRAPVHSEDEIGRLAEAFNRMTDRLLESNRRLRNEIEEQRARTPPPTDRSWWLPTSF